MYTVQDCVQRACLLDISHASNGGQAAGEANCGSSEISPLRSTIPRQSAVLRQMVYSRVYHLQGKWRITLLSGAKSCPQEYYNGMQIHVPWDSGAAPNAWSSGIISYDNKWGWEMVRFPGTLACDTKRSNYLASFETELATKN